MRCGSPTAQAGVLRGSRAGGRRCAELLASSRKDAGSRCLPGVGRIIALSGPMALERATGSSPTIRPARRSGPRPGPSCGGHGRGWLRRAGSGRTRCAGLRAMLALSLFATATPALASAPPAPGLRVVWVEPIPGSGAAAADRLDRGYVGASPALQGVWPRMILSNTAPAPSTRPDPDEPFDLRGRRLPHVSSGAGEVRREASPWRPRTPLPR